MVLPDGPPARRAATSWRVYLFWVDVAALSRPLGGIEITPVPIETLQLAFVGGGAVSAWDGDVVEAEVDA
jgi:hypothetical protein